MASQLLRECFIYSECFAWLRNRFQMCYGEQTKGIVDVDSKQKKKKKKKKKVRTVSYHPLTGKPSQTSDIDCAVLALVQNVHGCIL